MSDNHDELVERIEELEEQNRALFAKLQQLGEKITDTQQSAGKQRAGINQRISEVETETDERFGTLDERTKAIVNQLALLDDLDPVRSTKEEKVARIRRKLIKLATRNGVATIESGQHESKTVLDYKDIWRLFDGELSEAYATTLLTDAAEHPAFCVEKPGTRKQLRVDVSKLPKDVGFIESKRDDGSLSEQITAENEERSQEG